MNDEAYMRLAIEQAKIADDKAEVPVGCVIVDEQGEVISRGHNLREGLNDPTAHAEMMARSCLRTFSRLPADRNMFFKSSSLNID